MEMLIVALLASLMLVVYDDEMRNEMISQFIGEMRPPDDEGVEIPSKLTQSQRQAKAFKNLPWPDDTLHNGWEMGFLETMSKAKDRGWKLSLKQLSKLEDIICKGDMIAIEREGMCSCQYDEEERRYWDGDCPSCVEKKEIRDAEQYKIDHAHMTQEEIDIFYEAMSDAHHYVNYINSDARWSFDGVCPLSYDPSGRSRGFFSEGDY